MPGGDVYLEESGGRKAVLVSAGAVFAYFRRLFGHRPQDEGERRNLCIGGGCVGGVLHGDGTAWEFFLDYGSTVYGVVAGGDCGNSGVGSTGN